MVESEDREGMDGNSESDLSPNVDKKIMREIKRMGKQPLIKIIKKSDKAGWELKKARIKVRVSISNIIALTNLIKILSRIPFPMA